MSELKSVYIDRTGDWCRSGNNTGRFYLREEADKVIAELEDKLRHYPMMTALIESSNKEIAELKDKLRAADKQIENLINSASSIMLAQDKVINEKCNEAKQ